MTTQALKLADYKVPTHLIDQTELSFDLQDEADTIVSANIHFTANPKSDDSSSLFLNGEQMTLKEISIDGVALSENQYTLTDEGLTLLNVPERFSLQTKVAIKPQENTALEGLYTSGGKFTTQCEAEGFRRITYYMDRPDVLTKFKVSIEADKTKYPQLLSNGNLIESKDLENGRHLAVWDDPWAKPCYLFALVAGSLTVLEDSFKTMSGKEVTLKILCAKEDGDKIDHAMESLKKSMTWDEETYGLEYDLNIFHIVAVSDFNMGAMENKSLNIFNTSCVLAHPDTTTDAGYNRVEAVVAHEYFHNYSGNRVTCNNWFQLSLKEGLTVNRDSCFTMDVTSRATKRIEDVKMMRAYQFNEDAGANAHAVRPIEAKSMNNLYTLTIYEKGSEVIHMYKQIIGLKNFRKGTDLYFKRFDGQAVAVEDFRDCMAEVSGVDLTQFTRWYDQAGTPVVDVTSAYDATAKTFTLNFKQSCPATPGQPTKEPFHIPVKMGLLDSQGNDMVLETEDTAYAADTSVFHLKGAEQSITFTNVKEVPLPSLLRDFSAPITLNYEYSDAELARLITDDNDPVNRWDAGQRLAMRATLNLIDQFQNDQDLEVNTNLISALGEALNEKDDLSMIADMFMLPSFSEVAQKMDVIDPDAILAATKALKDTLAQAHEEKLLSLYNAHQLSGEYKYQPVDVAKRRVQGLALSLLCRLGKEEYIALATARYDAALNYTEVGQAMDAILQKGSNDQKDQMLNAHYTKWQSEDLMIDDWFRKQVVSSKGTQIAESLTKHANFKYTNPNRARSVIGAFMMTPKLFHAKDGEGYRFVADQILAMDKINPQTAARFCDQFSIWSKLDEDRKALIKPNLERILSAKELSKDVKSKIENCLESA